MFKRSLSNNLPENSFFLFGPRQVGKSTLLKKARLDLMIDLLNPEQQLLFTKNPNLLRDQIKAITTPGPRILIDEIQRVPQLLDVIHLLLEERPECHFMLCGSSARKLRHGTANLLGGRALYRTLHPLASDEMPAGVDLAQILAYGSLPKIVSLLLANNTEDVRDRLRAYVITYLREEIKAEALVRNLQGFQNFLDVAAAQYTQQVNFSAIARDCQVALATVREFYHILEDTLMGQFLYPYLKSERKRLSRHPKFYFFDNGVTRALLGTLQDPPTLRERGYLFEQWIIQEVIRINDYQQKDWKLFFWRTSHGAEVDLLIGRGQQLLCAIECKWSPSPSLRDLSGLKSFHSLYPTVPIYVVAPVQQPSQLAFARVLSPSTLWSELQGRY